MSRAHILPFIAVAVFVLPPHASPGAQAAATLVVTNVADSGAGSLRQAILDANASPGTDTIAFALQGSPPFVIEPQSELPRIEDAVVIDGTTQCAPACQKPVVEIRNSFAPGGGFGLRLYRAGHTTIEGLSIVGWGTAISAQEPGPAGTTCGCGQNVFAHNYIGLEPDGTVPDVLGNQTRPAGSGWGTTGIEILNFAACAPRPASPPADYCLDGNVVRDNVSAGIGGAAGGTLIGIGSFGTEGADRNTIQGNRLGTTPDGTALVAACCATGIELSGNSSDNRIGYDPGDPASTDDPSGPCSGDCNLVSSLGGAGAITIIGGSRDTIEGNFIGTDIVGAKVLATPALSPAAGIWIQAGDSTIGGIDPRQRNLIENNRAGEGIEACGGCGSVADNLVIEGNYIGTDVTGTKAIGTGFAAGISVGAFSGGNPTGVRIGGTAGADTPSCDGACNLISGNAKGIQLSAFDSTIEGNFIGTDVSGTKPLGNTGPGVDVGDGLYSSGNTIGGLAPGAGNLIAYNGTDGVVVPSALALSCAANASCVGDAILSNRIFANAAQETALCFGIQLGDWPGCFGPHLNDPGDFDTGVNDVQNFPVLSSVVSGGGETTVTGTLDSRANADGIVYRLEFFTNERCGFPGYGEGQFLLGAADVTIKDPTSPAAVVPFTVTFPTPLGLPGPVVTATATNLAENWTSEFSRCLETSSGGRIVVVKQTQPTGSTQSFAFTASYAPTGFLLSDGQSNDSGVLAAATYSVAEPPVSGWDTTASCDNGDQPGAITLAAAQTVTCTFVNTRRGVARVVKTVNRVPPNVGQAFTFQLREGSSTTTAGTILEQLVANAANGGVVAFTTNLVPGTAYALCETVMPGWMTTLGPPLYVAYNPSGDNSTVCADFTVDPGQTRTFAIDNETPPGGLARTIGFWKNWASCAGSNGNQKPVLDQTLAAAEPSGITIGTLTLHGSTSTPSTSLDCLKATRLLNKSTVDAGKKMSSDPAFNVAAQLLAADLNVVAGAGTCPAAVSAINDAQTLLASSHFNGITHDKLNPTQATQATGLGTTLDRYNNNLLC